VSTADDIKDVNDWALTDGEPPPNGERRRKRGKKEATEEPRREITWRTASQITDRCPEWAWKYDDGGRLMRDTLILFAGRPDAGKSTAARYFGAGYTRGTIPGCFHGHPQNIAYIASEESLEVMVKPSLRAHNADMDRVYFPEVKVGELQVRLLSTVDETALTAFLLDQNIKVVIVDPVMSAIGSTADIHRNNETREYLEPWARIAEAINGLVIGIVHLIKAPGGDIVAAINGSSAFGEVARAVIAFAKDPESEDVRVLSQEKNNAGRSDLALSYRIESTTVTTDDGKQTPVGQFSIAGPSGRSVGDLFHADTAHSRLGKISCQVLEAVRQAGEPCDLAMVAALVPGLSSDDAGKYLRRLAQNELLIKVGRGMFDHPSRAASP
jgi:hypothetical protein